MSVILLVLLAGAVAVLAAAEWPRLTRGRIPSRPGRSRSRRKSHLKLIRPERSESDEFAASVERDLARLPTIEERDSKRR